MNTKRHPDYELTEDGDIWVALHVETGVASQGTSPTEAVAMAQEAARLHQKPHSPGDDTYQREMLERFGIESEDVAENIDTPGGMP